MADGVKNNVPNLENEKLFKASDAIKASGLSYRQLNDWEEKGVLSAEREKEAEWRKFTGKELFTLMVCKEMRDRFGVPLESLGYVRSFMSQEGANHFKYAFEMIRDYGMTIYILTDLKSTFVMDTDLEFKDLFQMGFFRLKKSQAFISIKINPIIDRMLALIGIPPLKTSNVIYEAVDRARQGYTVQGTREADLLNIIRSRKFKRVTVYTDNGDIMRFDTEEELADKAKNKLENQILKVIKEQKFQSITIQIHNGKIVRLSRRSPIKLGKTAEKS